MSMTAIPGGVLFRGMVAGILFTALAILHGPALVEACLPVYRIVFSWLMDDFNLRALTLDREGADRVVRATVGWKPVVVLDGRVLYPDPRGSATASTLAAHALQGPLVMLAAAFAWPAYRMAEYAWRGLLLVPLLAVLVLSDVPVVLAGELWRMVRDALALNLTSPLLTWTSFVHGGGRYALALAAALAAVQGGKWLSRRTAR